MNHYTGKRNQFRNEDLFPLKEVFEMYTDTIAAIASSSMRNAISIIRVSGEEAIPIVNSIFDRDLTKKPGYTLTYGFIQEDGKPVDEVLVSVFRGPRSFTAEDSVEINCHGGPYITRKILELVLSHGARLAKPGEFTQRAFLNGRIDLSQAEAVEDMIEANSQAASSLAVSNLRGSVRKLLDPLTEDLLNLIANIEVNIDYPEYDDVEELTFHHLLPEAEAILNRIDTILKQSRRGQIQKEGLSTAIIGKPNVGKSSLLNALLEEDKAIVTDIPGTTRDIVEGQIRAGNLQLNLIDTAGIRKSDNPVEQIGIEKSKKMIDSASLILLVLDGSRPLDEQDQKLLEMTEGKDRFILINKSDLNRPTDFPDGISISAASGQIEGLLEALDQKYSDAGLSYDLLLGNERQIGLLENARKDIMNAIQAMKQEVEPDLIEIDLQEAYRHLKEITGEVHREDLLDTLFSNFCLGK